MWQCFRIQKNSSTGQMDYFTRKKVVDSSRIKLEYNPKYFLNESVFISKQPYLNSCIFVHRVVNNHNRVKLIFVHLNIVDNQNNGI